jgi:hypothetical protein
MRMPKKGEVVEFELWDHHLNDKEEDLHRVTAHGKVVEVTPDKVVLDSWYPTDHEEWLELERKSSDARSALETFTIIRGAIKAWYYRDRRGSKPGPPASA